MTGSSTMASTAAAGAAPLDGGGGAEQQRRRRQQQQRDLSALLAGGDVTLTPWHFRRAAELLSRCWQHQAASARAAAAAGPSGGASAAAASVASARRALPCPQQPPEDLVDEQQPCWTLGESMRHSRWELERAGGGRGGGRPLLPPRSSSGAAADGAVVVAAVPPGLLTSAFLPHGGPERAEEEAQCRLAMRRVPHQRPAADDATVAAGAAPRAEAQQGGEEEDAASVGAGEWPDGAPPHLYDVVVALHPTYRVPTLFLSATRADGSPLSWQDMERDFPWWERRLRGQLGDAPWALLGPADEFVDDFGCGGGGGPLALMVHPCRTAEVMRLLLLSSGQEEDEEEEEEEVVDLDDALAMEEGGGYIWPPASGVEGVLVGADGPWQPAAAPGGDGPLAGGEGLDGALLRYMLAWLSAVAAPVLGLRMDPAWCGTMPLHLAHDLALCK